MPAIEIDGEELRRLVDRDANLNDLVDDLSDLGLSVETETTRDTDLRLELPENRPDLLSIEGVARALGHHRGINLGVVIPTVSESDFEIHVDESVTVVRPQISGAVITGLNLGSDELDSLINLKQMLNQVVGKDSTEASVGLHDLTMIKAERIDYRAIEPDEDTFVPLDEGYVTDETPEERRGTPETEDENYLSEMSPQDVLDKHPVAEEKEGILEGEPRYPALYDPIGLFSFPPLVTGKRTEVTEKTRELLIEVTGTDASSVKQILNIMLYAFDARGGKINEVEISYPDGTVIEPDLSATEYVVDHSEIEQISGREIEQEEVYELAERSGMDIRNSDENEYEVEIPPYRMDIDDSGAVIEEMITHISKLE